MHQPILHSLVAAASLTLAAPPQKDATPSQLQNVNYGAFTQTATYSIANELGFFEAYGLNVTYLQIPNSTYGYAQLLNGGYDIATGTIDNAVNLRFNSNKNLTVIGQLDQGPELSIASIPSITDPTQLKGLALMVDSPTVGSTNLRYADLVAGHLPNGTDVYATILTYPFPALAQALPATTRPNIIANISDFIQPISSSAFTIRQAALTNTTERSVIRSFMSAMYAANQYLAASTPKSQKCSVEAIASQLNVTTDIATTAYAAATDPLTGETTSPNGNFTVSRQGLLNIIDVRSQFGGFASVPAGFNYAQAILPGTGKLIDYSITEEAIAAVNGYKPNGNCS
ncbi:hypothetical protein LTR62_001001 [Meristemomyces frigidus]|uniref:SsuA/THI5-like domain-containing protein n=1 Tax=Meristemomyces frigidus TaxID=1508187 RepID=A0AAN7YC06_9PEZI|nr:hypothetical protein LTR62_001001 [Meristemomyces frigidus]